MHPSIPMWQYKTEIFGSTFKSLEGFKKASQELLTKAGNEGWELVNFQSIGAANSLTMFVFKKRLD